MLGSCWANVEDVGPALTQYWINACNTTPDTIQPVPEIDPMLIKYWSTIYDAGPELNHIKFLLSGR